MNNNPHINSTKTLFEYLLSDSKDEKLVFFCGAGVSIKSPASLPSAPSIVESILNELIETRPEYYMELIGGSHIFLNSPFEMFISVIQQGLQDRVFDVLQQLRTGEPNTLHKYISQLLINNKIKHLITTNFDDMFESALEDHIKDINFYYSLKDIEGFSKKSDEPSIIKAHGSFYDEEGNDISRSTILTTTESIFQSGRTKTLKKWAKQFEDHTLVFLGYGGNDRLDIMPMLSYMRNTRIVWVDHKNNDSIDIGKNTDKELLKKLEPLKYEDLLITTVNCHTEVFLDNLGSHMEFKYSEIESNLPKRREVQDVYRGVIEPVFPKYADIVIGYLLMWASVYPNQALNAFKNANTSLSETDMVARADIYAACGQILEFFGTQDSTEEIYSSAIKVYYQNKDYIKYIKTNYYLIDFALKQNKSNVAWRAASKAYNLAMPLNNKEVIALASFAYGKYDEYEESYDTAANFYKQAIEAAEEFGDLWIEAGSRQAIVRVTHKLHGEYTEESINHLLLALNSIFWIGSGTTKSLKIASMYDVFEICEMLINALVEVKGRKALEFIKSNSILMKIDQQLPTSIYIKVEQKL